MCSVIVRLNSLASKPVGLCQHIRQNDYPRADSKKRIKKKVNNKIKVKEKNGKNKF
jgi:hypothetical protein